MSLDEMKQTTQPEGHKKVEKNTFQMGTQIPLFSSKRSSLPFPHPWNFRQPIKILKAFYEGADPSKEDIHNRVLKIPFMSPVLVTRDPELIKAITLKTGDKIDQFDRDTLPTDGIARATGEDTLLYANGEVWKRQKKLSSGPFKKSSLFNPEKFKDFEILFRETVKKRLGAFHKRVESEGKEIEVELEQEIKVVMLELLTNCFFGTDIEYDELWDKYVPALDNLISNIVRDTVLSKVGISIWKLPPMTSSLRELKRHNVAFNELTDLVLATRKENKGLWNQFKSDAEDKLLRNNIKVFLAGALEATTSYAAWAISHLARHPKIQDDLYEELKDIEDFTPEKLKESKLLLNVLNETLRLTPSLYFLPRLATSDMKVETDSGRVFEIPKGTHILLDVWHSNHHEEFWGKEKTGFDADEFVPERWEYFKQNNLPEPLHFGFGYGPRICPGKNLGQMEVALVVGVFVKLMKFRAVKEDLKSVAGVSTKPADGVHLKISLREE